MMIGRDTGGDRSRNRVRVTLISMADLSAPTLAALLATVRVELDAEREARAASGGLVAGGTRWRDLSPSALRRFGALIDALGVASCQCVACGSTDATCICPSCV